MGTSSLKAFASRTLLAVCALVAAPLQATGPTGSGGTDPLTRTVRTGAGEVQALVLGQGYSPSYRYDQDKTCHELYQEMRALTPRTYNYQPAYTDDPRNAAAVFIGTIFTPAFYYLGFTALQDYRAQQRIAKVEQRITELRAVSGEKRCWLK